jgi:uncharacterized membrane protein
MKQSNIFALTKPQSYLKLMIWCLLIAFAGKFIIRDALPYFGFEKATFGHYWEYKWWLIGHVSGGLIAITIGPFQFWKTFRNKYLKVHRWLGRIYLIAILIGTICSTYLAWTSALAAHWTWAISLQALSLAWICTAAMAYRAIMKRRIQQHKEWMIKSYVLTFSFVCFRWLVDLPFVVELGSFIERAPTVIWISLIMPLFITEIVLSWNKK